MPSSDFCCVAMLGEGQKGTAEGDGTENVTTISDTFPTVFRHFYDIPMLCSCDMKAS